MSEGRRVMRIGGAVLALALLLAPPASAATLKVGPEAELKTPSAAARVAQDGDTIEIAPGEYFDCAVWRANGLTITGPSDPATPAVLSDASCLGKALFVVGGRDVTIRHLTFTRVRVPDGNGAGIRAEGGSLTVEHSRFVNNEVGILAVDMPLGTLAILDSAFEGNGACNDARCGATVQAGALLRLRIERSSFTGSRGGDLVRAWPQRSDILESRFTDGPRGAAARLLAIGGGAMLVSGNQFEKGPIKAARDAAQDTAVELRDLWGPVAGMLFQRNTLINNTGHKLVFVHNLTAGTVRLEGNTIGPGDTALDESGYWVARARSMARSAIDEARGLAGQAKRFVHRALNYLQQ